MKWWQKAPVIERFNEAIVLREDLVEGGSKVRFLPHLVSDAKEIVFGGPFCGGAPYALSVWGKYEGVKITLFYAQRKELHWRQIRAKKNGAKIVQVPAGRMTVVQHRARTYAQKKGALFLPLGFDVPSATHEYECFFGEIASSLKLGGDRIDEVWCATGSGMLARCLARAFPYAKVFGVVVGLASRHKKQDFPRNVELVETEYDFAEPCVVSTPFPCDQNYETKAWEAMIRHGARRKYKRRLFINVAGDSSSP